MPVLVRPEAQAGSIPTPHLESYREVVLEVENEDGDAVDETFYTMNEQSGDFFEKCESTGKYLRVGRFIDGVPEFEE